MDEFVDRLEAARERLQAQDTLRDAMLDRRRTVTSGARTVVNLVHQRQVEEADEQFEKTLAEVADIRAKLGDAPVLWRSGALRNALQEVAEAWATLRLAGSNTRLPDDAVTDEALVLGLADTVGELRRMALDALIEGDTAHAAERLDQMERLYEALRTIDVSSGVVDHRHKVDVARQLVDKTRGTVALGRIEQRLQTRSQSHG